MYKYVITITNKNDNIDGKLQILDNSKEVQSANFNPELILCDLVDANKILKIENDTLDIEYYKYEKSFGIDLYVYDDAQYWNFREKLIKIIKGKKRLSIEDLEKIKVIYKMEVDCQISNKNIEISKFKEFNGRFHKNLTDEQAERIKNIYEVLKDETLDIMEEYKNSDEEISEEKKKELDDLYNKFNTSSKESIKNDYNKMVKQLDTSIEQQIKFDNDFVYTYTCFSVSGILYSILHYLVANKYRFLRCPHCKNYFATKKRNAVYCKRKSKLKGYENRDCGSAQATYIKKLKKRKEYILTYLNNYCDNYNLIEKFKVRYKNLFKMVSSNPTIENLEKLNNLLSKEYIQEHYYKYNIKTRKK